MKTSSKDFYLALEEGRFLLDELRSADIQVWISKKTGSLLAANNHSPYFQQKLREHAYAVKLALEIEEGEE